MRTRRMTEVVCGSRAEIATTMMSETPRVKGWWWLVDVRFSTVTKCTIGRQSLGYEICCWSLTRRPRTLIQRMKVGYCLEKGRPTSMKAHLTYILDGKFRTQPGVPINTSSLRKVLGCLDDRVNIRTLHFVVIERKVRLPDLRWRTARHEDADLDRSSIHSIVSQDDLESFL